MPAIGVAGAGVIVAVCVFLYSLQKRAETRGGSMASTAADRKARDVGSFLLGGYAGLVCVVLVAFFGFALWQNVLNEKIGSAIIVGTLLTVIVGLTIDRRKRLHEFQTLSSELQRADETRWCECEVAEGSLHAWGCKWECCPFCGREFIEDCRCAYYELGLMSDAAEDEDESPFLRLKASEQELSEAEQTAWRSRCELIGRIPFVSRPQLCAHCGELWPDLFHVPDKTWQHYATPALAGEVVCESCFYRMKEAIDSAKKLPTAVEDQNS